MPPEPPPLHVLVIDDHEFMRRTVKMVLSRLGVTSVVEAETAAEAKAALEREATFDMILCDLQLDGIDGVELLRTMPTLSARTALVIASGESEASLAEAADRARAAGLNVVATLMKPLTVPMLAELLSRFR